jgi:hypothetical protein
MARRWIKTVKPKDWITDASLAKVIIELRQMAQESLMFIGNAEELHRAGSARDSVIVAFERAGVAAFRLDRVVKMIRPHLSLTVRVGPS